MALGSFPGDNTGKSPCSLDIPSASFILDAWSCNYHNLSEMQTHGEASHSLQEAGMGLGIHAQSRGYKGLGNKGKSHLPCSISCMRPREDEGRRLLT